VLNNSGRDDDID